MKAIKNANHKALREIIRTRLNPEEELPLKSLVRIPNNSMQGYGDICALYRYGKKGVGCVMDVFCQFYPLSKLSEEECEKILANIPARYITI